ncbi:MAG: hypothetical protein ACLP01_07915 [Solirubrobacteraceae bacterium]
MGPTAPGRILTPRTNQALALCGTLGDALLIGDQQPVRRLPVRRTVPEDSSSRN